MMLALTRFGFHSIVMKTCVPRLSVSRRFTSTWRHVEDLGRAMSLDPQECSSSHARCVKSELDIECKCLEIVWLNARGTSSARCSLQGELTRSDGMIVPQ